MATALVCAALALAPTSAHAQSARSDPEQERVANAIEAALELNEGSKQIDATTVELEPGVRMEVTSLQPDVSGEARAQYYFCDYKWLCLFQHRDVLGYKISFYNCGYQELWHYWMPNGQRWNDQVSSVINNQTPGTITVFSDWNGVDDYVFMGLLTAPGHLYNLAWDEAHYGGTMNDRIDRVTVC